MKKLIPWWFWTIIIPFIILLLIGGCKVLTMFKPAPIMN